MSFLNIGKYISGYIIEHISIKYTRQQGIQQKMLLIIPPKSFIRDCMVFLILLSIFISKL